MRDSKTRKPGEQLTTTAKTQVVRINTTQNTVAELIKAGVVRTDASGKHVYVGCAEMVGSVNTTTAPIATEKG